MKVWLFAYYDAYNDLQIKLIKSEKVKNRWLKNWSQSGMWFSLTEHYVPTKN